MRRLLHSVLLVGCLIVTPAIAGGPVTFNYVGKALHHNPGTGTLPGITHLTFSLTGSIPAKGECINNETIVEASDGANTLSGLLAQGWVYATDGNEFQICKDKSTGALSEFFSLDLFSPSGTESLLWQSLDPDAGGGQPDTDSYYFINSISIGYGSKAIGRLRLSK